MFCCSEKQNKASGTERLYFTQTPQHSPLLPPMGRYSSTNERLCSLQLSSSFLSFSSLHRWTNLSTTQQTNTWKRQRKEKRGKESERERRRRAEECVLQASAGLSREHWLCVGVSVLSYTNSKRVRVSQTSRSKLRRSRAIHSQIYTLTNKEKTNQVHGIFKWTAYQNDCSKTHYERAKHDFIREW